MRSLPPPGSACACCPWPLAELRANASATAAQRRRMKHSIVCFALLALSMSAMAARADPGVTPTTILIGESAAFTGPASELGTEMRAGALAYFQAINAAGGVN